MSASSRGVGERVAHVRCTAESLVVDLVDGRTLSVPLARYPRLIGATPEQRAHWKPAGAGFGIHWPDVDEELSIDSLLRGVPAPGCDLRSEPEQAVSVQPVRSPGRLSARLQVAADFDAPLPAEILAPFEGGHDVPAPACAVRKDRER